MQALLGKSEQRARFIFDTYAANPIPIGVCAQALGVSTLELTQGWPKDAVPMRVCNGDTQERALALDTLGRSDLVVVIDLPALGEIVALDCEEALGAFPKLLISSAAKQVLEQLIEAATHDRAVGRAASIDGQMRIVEYSAEYKAERLRYLEKVASAIDRYCTVQPVYGTADDPPDLLALEEVLGDDEYEALLLARQTGGTLFSLDFPLRQLAREQFSVSGIWTQPCLAHAATIGLLSPFKYRLAAQSLFRTNRTYVSLDGDDILVMCQQGGDALTFGIAKVREIFASATSDSDSCTHVVEDFLRKVMSTKISLGTLADMVAFMYEPLFRHPAPLKDLKVRASNLMRTLSGAFRHIPAWIPLEPAQRPGQAHQQAVFQLLFAAVQMAEQRSKTAKPTHVVPFRVVYVTRIPHFISVDRNILEQG